MRLPIRPFDVWFWRYLLAKPFSWRAFLCRLRGHPEGAIWYNPCGLEPDMRCKNCDDYLG